MWGRRRRVLRSVAVVAAMMTGMALAPVTSAGAADVLPPLADPTAPGAVCDDVEGGNPFTDLDGESAGTREVILCLVATGLTVGTSPDTFTPGGTVTRRQMAMFVKRLADLLDRLEGDAGQLSALPAYDDEPDYDDVAGEDEGFQEAIGQLTQAGIVGGFGDGTFRPGAAVSRRQMAAFVNQLQDHLTGERYPDDGNYFDDDDGDSGEDDLDALAGVGIFQGDGQGNVDPGGDLTRRQMANILLRDVQVFHDDGLIRSPFGGNPEPTLTLEPTADASITFTSGIDRTSDEDDRQYTASDLPASPGGYRATLFFEDNIDEDGSDRTFIEGGDPGIAYAGPVTARIITVNGSDVAAARTVGGIQPVDGTITFTVDGDGTEAIVPVVFTDGGTDTRLEIDANGSPLEPFGVGGGIAYVPADATDNSAVTGTVSLLGPGFAVVGNDVTESTVRFHADDTYRIGAPPTFTAVDEAAFQETLSVGDALQTCQGEVGAPGTYTGGAGNEYCLGDDAPANPTELTATVGSPADTAFRLRWTAASPADQYVVYAHDRACPNTAVDDLVELDRVSARTTSYQATGLDPATTYCFVVTTIESGDESDVAIGTGENDGDNSTDRTTAE